jgi:hypothetical protein
METFLRYLPFVVPNGEKVVEDIKRTAAVSTKTPWAKIMFSCVGPIIAKDASSLVTLKTKINAFSSNMTRLSALRFIDFVFKFGMDQYRKRHQRLLFALGEDHVGIDDLRAAYLYPDQEEDIFFMLLGNVITDTESHMLRDMLRTYLSCPIRSELMIICKIIN